METKITKSDVTNMVDVAVGALGQAELTKARDVISDIVAVIDSNEETLGMSRSDMFVSIVRYVMIDLNDKKTDLFISEMAEMIAATWHY